MDTVLAYSIVILAIVGGITYAIFNQHFRTRRAIAARAESRAPSESLRSAAEATARLLVRIDALEARMDALEKAASGSS